MPDTNKEIDKDLTMLQGPKEPSFDEIFSQAESTITPTEGPKTQFDEAAIQSLQEMELYDSKIREGSVDTELDEGMGLNESVNTVRARNQSEGIKGLKAIAGGIFQGGLIAAEQLGYVADYNTYFNVFREQEDLSGNWWTNALKDMQEKSRENDTFKIYEDEADQNSILGQIFKWSSLEGAISSAVGFGLPGIGVAKVVGKLGSMGKIRKLEELADIALGYRNSKSVGQATEAAYKAGLAATKAAGNSLGAAGRTKAFTGPLASSTMSNFFMGQMMGADTYKLSLDKLNAERASGRLDISELEAQKMASHEAQDAVELNMALVATGVLKFKSIFKRKGRIAGLMSNPGGISQLKELVKTGSTTAFTENVYQEMIQMEQIHDTMKGAGLDSEYSDDYFKRMSQLALSNRAVHAGALGVVGGPIQFALLQKPFESSADRKEMRDAYEAQQKGVTWADEVKGNKYKNFNEVVSVTNKAILEGDMKAAELTEELGVMEGIVDMVQSGSIDYLVDDMKELAKMSPEKAEEVFEGEFDADYKETAEGILESIAYAKALQQEYSKIPDVDQVIYNRLANDKVKSTIAKSRLEQIQMKMKFEGELVAEVPESKGLILNDKGVPTRDSSRFDGMDSTQKSELRKKEKVVDDAIAKFIKTNPTPAKLDTVAKRINKLTQLRDELDKRFPDLIDEKKAAARKAKADAAIKKVQEDQKDGGVKKGGTVKETVKKSYGKFKDVLKKATNRTAKEKEDAASTIKSWDEETMTKNSLTPKSFTSVDKEGLTGTFTPGDLRRSNDGRIFRVTRQMVRKGAEFAENLPVLVETNEKGSDLKGEKEFVLSDLGFLRPEVKPLSPRKGNKGYNGSSWGPYVTVDSPLKPNFVSEVQSKIRRAFDNVAHSVRGQEHVSPIATGEGLTPTAYSEAYPLSSRNNEVSYSTDPEIEVTIVPKVEEGETFLEIKMPNGDIVGRLDRNKNLNYGAIAKAASLGPTTAVISSKYTNIKDNLIKVRGEDGTIVRHDIKELKKDSQFLPNGRIYIARNPGPNALNVGPTTLSEKGELLEEDFIAVTKPDGTVENIDIPYASIAPGDVSVLVLNPDGVLIPMATAGARIGDTRPGYAQEAATRAQEIADRIYPELSAENLEAWKEQTLKDLSTDGQGSFSSEAVLTSKLSNAMVELINEKERAAEFRTAIKESIGQDIAYDSNKIAYSQDVSTGERVYDSQDVRPGYFEIKYHVNEQTKVPGIAIYTADGEVGYKAGGNKNKFPIHELNTSPEAFYESLNKRFEKISIESMETAKGDPKAAEDLIFNSGTTTDIGPGVWTGTGLTLDFKDEQIRENATQYLSEASLKPVAVKEEFSKITDAQRTAVIEDFSEVVSFTADQVSNLPNMYSLSLAESFEEIISEGQNMLKLFKMKTADKIIKDFKEFMNNSVSIEKEAAVNETLDLIKASDITENLDDIAKATVFFTDTLEKIKDGTIELYGSTPLDKVGNPEGLVFAKGKRVYNSTHGVGVISKVYGKGKKYAMVIDAGPNGGKTKTVYANNTFTVNGDHAKLAKAEKQAARLKPGPRREAVVRQINTIKNRINKVEAPNQTEAENESAIAAHDTATIEAVLKLYDSFQDENGNSIPVEKMSIDKIYANIHSPETSSFVKSSKTIYDTLQSFEELEARGVPADTVFTQEEVDQLQEKHGNSYAWNYDNVDDLIALAKTAVDAGNISGDVLEFLDEYKDMMKEIKDSKGASFHQMPLWVISKNMRGKARTAQVFGSKSTGSDYIITRRTEARTRFVEASRRNKSMQNLAEHLMDLNGVVREKIASVPKSGRVRNPGEKVSRGLRGEGIKPSSEVQATIDALSSNPKGIEKIETDGRRFYQDKDGNRFLGLSTIVNPSTFDEKKNPGWGEAKHIGTATDGFLRDFFQGKVQPYSGELENRITKEAYDQLLKTAESMRDSFIGDEANLDHIEFITEGLFLSNKDVKASQAHIDNSLKQGTPAERKMEYGIATEMDMAVVNKKTGEVTLVDFKTARTMPGTTVEGNMDKIYSGESQSKKQGYTKQQNASRIITELNDGIKFESMKLMTIETQYNQYGSQSSTAKVTETLMPLDMEGVSETFPSAYAAQVNKAIKDKTAKAKAAVKSQPAQQGKIGKVTPENISSKGSEFAKKLTNPGNNLKVTYKGKEFRNAEHAYQTYKSGEFDQKAYNSNAFKPVGSKPANRNTNYQTMVDILKAKLEQHPKLIEGINKRGGLTYIKESTHNVTGDRFWESKGQNKFIEALAQAYKVTKLASIKMPDMSGIVKPGEGKSTKGNTVQGKSKGPADVESINPTIQVVSGETVEDFGFSAEEVAKIKAVVPGDVLDRAIAAVNQTGDPQIIIAAAKARGAKFQTNRGKELTQAEFREEVRRAKEMLPKVPIQVLEDVTAMSNKFGVRAIGAYHKGVTYLINNADKGTAFHETFHAVADLHLTPFQKTQMAEELGSDAWNLDVEERLADMFADYVTSRETVADRLMTKVREFFQKMIDWVTRTPSRKVVDEVFEKISEGGYASSNSLQYLGAMESNKRTGVDVESIKASINPKDVLTLQKLIDTNKVKIVC